MRYPANRTSKNQLLFVLLVLFLLPELSRGQNSYISNDPEDGLFTLASPSELPSFFVDTTDYKGVKLVAEDLAQDIERVTGRLPRIDSTGMAEKKVAVVIGTLGKSQLIEQLKDSGKLDVSGIEGKWEAFDVEVVDHPFPNMDKALVIVGSDKRGTIFGMYDVSEKIGVSPWYWWADVPAKKSSALYVTQKKHESGSPKVKYRGIFINDEAPALSGWVQENYGDFNSKFYEHVFELILRLKGNFLWPAMWGRAFYDDDPRNPELADDYGVVIGTSHHEPLMRAHDEWRRYGEGDWDYTTNAENLQDFWRKGVERMGDNESLATIGMRGDGDKPMSQGTAIGLLEKIVDDQRDIIADVTGKPAKETPQVWALYKEVQDYYDQGMRVPDDVTLLLSDDNWGNIRKLPDPDEEPRKGGYGIYYHFDYVGGPRNYKWINTNQISRVWEQMHLAYKFGANRLWIVNVGDIKPMEYPISFFLDYAWDPEKIKAEDLQQYAVNWAGKEFPEKYAPKIAEIIQKYTKYNSRRKPELLSPDTYSLVNFAEADKVLQEFDELEQQSEKIYKALPDRYKDAFYQLVLYPVKASANLNRLYIAVAKNRLYANQGRASANLYAEKAEEFFKKDQELTDYYHTKMAGGKWNHMMSQVHIGYSSWQEPRQNLMPEVEKLEIPETKEMDIAVEGSEKSVSEDSGKAYLPAFSPSGNQKHYFDIFNKGSKPFNYKIKVPESWIHLSSKNGKLDLEKRNYVNVDWSKVPQGTTEVPLEIKGAGRSIKVWISVRNPADKNVKGFVESEGYISIPADKYFQKSEGEHAWQEISNLGRTGSAISSDEIEPGTEFSKDNPTVSYRFYTFENSSSAKLIFLLSPTLDFLDRGGLRFAVSVDGRQPEILNLQKNTDDNWNVSVSNNSTRIEETVDLDKGQHKLQIWAIDPGIVLQKIIIRTKEKKDSYLGPPESTAVQE